MSRDTKSGDQYFIGEWFGQSFADIDTLKRHELLEYAKGPIKMLPCPFREGAKCNKKGGVCSLRLYERNFTSGTVTPSATAGGLRTTCPHRFEEGNRIYAWVGEVMLGNSSPTVLSEMKFLARLDEKIDAKDKAVGKIDNVLVTHRHGNISNWCALEKQAVYFQGKRMSYEWSTIEECTLGIPYPQLKRKPDYRSSGPKRLMPQLQIKIPTLRRWGKKMAVVIDEDFFQALGHMDTIESVSNADIGWFVVGYDQCGSTFKLSPREVVLTTLEKAVEGLTAGLPVDLAQFEDQILAKLKRQEC